MCILFYSSLLSLHVGAYAFKFKIGGLVMWRRDNKKKNENERTPGVHETMLAVAGTCGHVSTCSLFSGCASVILNMSVHVCLYCTVYKERWALNSFGDTRVPVCHCICSYPPPHAHAPPLLLSDPTFPLPSSSGHDYWGGTPSGLRVRSNDT